MLVDNVQGDSVHLHKVLGELQFHFWSRYIVPAAKRVSADLLEFAVPEIAEIVSGRKNFKSAAKSVGKQTLKKTIEWREQEKDCKQNHSSKICKTSHSVARRHFYKHVPLFKSSNFRHQTFVAISGNFGGNVPVVGDVLSSHEQEI